MSSSSLVGYITTATAIVVGLAGLTKAADQILIFFGLVDRTRLRVYRSLVADLEGLERSVHSLASIHFTPPNAPVEPAVETVVAVGQMRSAAKPVCDARKSVSELGDVETRHRLDVICGFVDAIEALFTHTYGGVGGIALARIMDELRLVPTLHDVLLTETKPLWIRICLRTFGSSIKVDWVKMDEEIKQRIQEAHRRFGGSG